MARSDLKPARLISNPSIVLAAIGVCIATSFSVLLPVAPVLLERIGPHGAAGAATAALFLGAVTGELMTPWLMSWVSSTRLLAGSQLVTAVLSLVFAIPHAAAWQMLAATGLRGVGMGVAIVVCVVLVAEVAPPNRRGHSIGLFGLALSTPGILLPSIGVALTDAGRADVTAVIAFGGGLAGAGLALRLPSRQAAGTRIAAHMVDAIRQPGLIAVFASFVLVSCSFGGVLTYTPIALPADGLGSAAAFLLVAGIARATSRWLGGLLGDRQPVKLVLAGGIGLAFIGLCTLAIHAGPVATLIAGVVYGSGYGTVQTGAYLAMTERSRATYVTAVSALYNSGIDLGASLGGTLLGLSAARFGYLNAFWVVPAVVLVSLPLALATGKPVPGQTIGDAQALPHTSSAAPR
jgi:predicted MFS family arabinose efflux permease